MDRMDFNHVQLPKEDVKVSSLRSSRPASPDIAAAAAATCDSGSNTPPWPTCNLKRHLSGVAATAAVNKKRKLEQAVIAAAATAVTNNSPSNAAVTMTTVSSTNSIMVSIMIIVVV